MLKNLKCKAKTCNLYLDYINAEESHSKFLLTKICLLEVKGEIYFCSVIKIAAKVSQIKLLLLLLLLLLIFVLCWYVHSKN